MCKSQHEKLLSFLRWPRLQSFVLVEVCRELMLCIPCLAGINPLRLKACFPILPHQPRDGHSTGKTEQLFWMWKTALVWQPVVWEHTRVSAALNLAALVGHSSGNPRRCNSPAAKGPPVGATLIRKCPR